MKTLALTAATILTSIGGILATGGNEHGGEVIAFAVVIYVFSPLLPKKKKYKPSCTEKQFNEAMDNIYKPKL